MSSPQIVPEHSSSHASSPVEVFRLQKTIVWVLWARLAGIAVWRVLLSLLILFQPPLSHMAGGAIVHWRRLDEFLPWMVLATFSLGLDGATRSMGQLRAGKLIATLVSSGAGFTGIGMVLEQAGLGESAEIFERMGYVVLAGLTLALAVRELRRIHGAITSVERRGVTVIDLWRFAAAQWGLLAGGAMLWVALATNRDERLGSEVIRSLFFFLPAAAFLPNAMMAGGISLWNDMLRASGAMGAAVPVPRVRAWLVAFMAMNVGPMLLLAGLLPRAHAEWLFFPGAALEIAAIVFYLVGFPAAAWQGAGGKAHLVAWACFAVALGAALFEHAGQMADISSSVFYGAAWRYVWATGAVTFWLVGQGATAMRLLVSEKAAERGGMLVLMLAVFGMVAATAVLLMTAGLAGDMQVPMMRWMILGTGMMLVAVIVGGAVMMRAMSGRGGTSPKGDR